MKILECRKLLILLKNDTRGVIAVITAIVLLPTLVLSIGAVVDYSIILQTRYIMQTALDAALLSSKIPSEGATEEEILQTIRRNFELNANKQIRESNPQLSITTSPDSVTAQAHVTQPLIAYRLLGMETTEITVSSSISLLETEPKSKQEDIVLVVDGLLFETYKIKQALREFTEIAMDSGNNTAEEIQIGTVLYGATVRLPSYVDRNTLWIDTDALSPIHSANFSSDINRFTLFDRVKVEWNGCIEVRPHPYDVHDYDPTFDEMTAEERNVGMSRDARFFVPWFEPDQMDKYGGNQRSAIKTTYVYDYPADETDPDFNFELPKNLQNRAITISENDQIWFMHQANTTKYFMDSRMRRYPIPSNEGPTGGCNYQAQVPMTTLTHNYNTVLGDLQQFTGLSRNPNMLQGFTWGWRVLSAGEPFTSNPDVPKTMFMLTTGNNFGSSFQDWSPNLGLHSAFGLPYENRLNVPGDIFNMSFTEYQDARNKIMDERLLQACEHAKADGVEIYMITLKLYNNHNLSEDRKKIIQTCASSEKHYYNIYITDFATIFGELYARETSKLKIFTK